IPAGLEARYARTSGGRAWLLSLPGLIRGCLDRWNLSVDLEPGAEPWSGHGGLVIPVTRDGGPAVLKVAFPHDEARVERHALTLWGGRGAVRLLEADAGTCSMVLERLDAGHSLHTEPMDHAREVWAGIMGLLSIVPDVRVEWFELEHVASRAEQWSDDLPV